MSDADSKRKDDEQAWLSPCFLGSYAENNQLLEQILLEFLRDHIYWRRNIHPEDTPPISALAQEGPEYRAFVARMKSRLHELSARLKESVPFFNPRYIGHMASDLLLPGLLAQLVATLYNPNNVVDEAAPVTLPLELEVGGQLAAMLGYNINPAHEPCAFGHLTSGGTMANNEALWYCRAVRYWPLAARRALVDADCDPGQSEVLQARIVECDDWRLFNLSFDQVIALHREWLAWLATRPGAEAREIQARTGEGRIETLGEAAFQACHPTLEPARVLVPMTAHYCWEKAMKLLGLGTARLEQIAVDHHMRLDADALNARLDTLSQNRTPVLAVIGVLGTTEFGTIDPIHEIVSCRQRLRRKGMDFAVHLDAAWGGYLASLFRGPDGTLLGLDVLRRDFRHFPSEPVYKAFAALRHADSITVDPHKLGYLPFGCGAYIARNRAQTDFVAQRAAYVFENFEASETDYDRRFRNLGQFILEGSKPGATAAAAWVTHKVLPLDHDHFGRLPAGTIRNCEYFYDVIGETRQRLEGKVRLIVPFEPDTNLICLAINPEDNRSLAGMNAFGRRLYAHLNVQASDHSIRQREFFGSRTLVERRVLGAERADELMRRLGLDPATFTEFVEDPEHQASSVFLLRHTLMNPWLTESDRGQNYLDRYLRYLEKLIEYELEPCA